MQDQIQSYLTFLAEEDEASENTVAAYRNDLSQLYTFLSRYSSPTVEGISTWGEVDSVVIQNYVLDLKARGYASSTVARKIAAVKSFFEYLTAKTRLPSIRRRHSNRPRSRSTCPTRSGTKTWSACSLRRWLSRGRKR